MPHPDLNAAMEFASHCHERLAAANRRLHFRLDPAGGRVIVEVHDLQGNVLFTVSPREALAIAEGTELEETGWNRLADASAGTSTTIDGS
jgi:hypothetical protein